MTPRSRASNGRPYAANGKTISTSRRSKPTTGIPSPGPSTCCVGKPSPASRPSSCLPLAISRAETDVPTHGLATGGRLRDGVFRAARPEVIPALDSALCHHATVWSGCRFAPNLSLNQTATLVLLSAFQVVPHPRESDSEDGHAPQIVHRRPLLLDDRGPAARTIRGGRHGRISGSGDGSQHRPLSGLRLRRDV